MLTKCWRTSFTERNIINCNSFILPLDFHHRPKDNLQNSTANQQEMVFTSAIDEGGKIKTKTNQSNKETKQNKNTTFQDTSVLSIWFLLETRTPVIALILEDYFSGFCTYLWLVSTDISSKSRMKLQLKGSI